MQQETSSLITRRAWMGGAALTAAAAAGTDSLDTPRDEAIVRIPAWFYQHFDADYSRDVPEEGFGGWEKESLEFARDRMAVVCMHAWDAGAGPDAFPGWWRCVPYLHRAREISREVFPSLFAAVRASGIPLFHVTGGGDYYKDYPGYRHAAALAAPEPSPERIPGDPVRERLERFRAERIFTGKDNANDVRRGFERLDFPLEARPEDGEGIAENGGQLFALCKERGVNHLVYCGFALNWCLLLSPGGMADMQRRGMMCSVLREATVAVENKESARGQLAKKLALWRVALAFGFVFDVEDFKRAFPASV